MKTEQYKKKLEEEKAKLESEMSSVGRRNTAVPGDWEAVPSEVGVEADIIDQAEIVTNRDTESAIFADLEARYDTVLEALKRIENKTFGVCEACGEPIEEARLGADPAATTCVKDL